MKWKVLKVIPRNRLKNRVVHSPLSHLWSQVTSFMLILQRTRTSLAIIKVNFWKRHSGGLKCRWKFNRNSPHYLRLQRNRQWFITLINKRSKINWLNLLRIRIINILSSNPTSRALIKSSWMLLFLSSRNCSRRWKARKPQLQWWIRGRLVRLLTTNQARGKSKYPLTLLETLM